MLIHKTVLVLEGLRAEIPPAVAAGAKLAVESDFWKLFEALDSAVTTTVFKLDVEEEVLEVVEVLVVELDDEVLDKDLEAEDVECTVCEASTPIFILETAFGASSTEPVPHGIFSFEPGCVWFVGGTTSPDDDAIVNLVVQAFAVLCGEEN